jgi:hypothetical protein
MSGANEYQDFVGTLSQCGSGGQGYVALLRSTTDGVNWHFSHAGRGTRGTNAISLLSIPRVRGLRPRYVRIHGLIALKLQESDVWESVKKLR